MHRALVLVVVLVVAGCVGGVAPGTDSSDEDAATATPVWDGDPDNHFREETLTVAVTDEAGTDREYRLLVETALDYWTANAEQYAGFPIDYELVTDASEPDIHVRFVSTIETCGSETDEFTAGCVPYLRDPREVDRPVTVRIETGYNDEATATLVKHELGHTLGLSHDDEPAAVMAAQSQLATLPQPSATERALPWAGPNLTYYVDDDAVPDDERDATHDQVDAALGYVADGADGTIPENVTFTRTTNRSAAHVVIRFAESDPCTDGSGSCGSLRGFDPDDDSALETYNRLEITVVDVDTDARGWHVGRWLAHGFGLRGEELPAPLRTEDPDVRRSEWWR